MHSLLSGLQDVAASSFIPTDRVPVSVEAHAGPITVAMLGSAPWHV